MNPTAPLWSSGFRPFFLGGAVWGPVAMLLWQLGLASPLWHGHEMIFGFATAIVCGVLLTALPSWSGAADVRGWRLGLLAALWASARLASVAGQAAPAGAAAVLDCALVPALIAMILPSLGGARWRLFVWTLPPLIALFAGNLVYHIAIGEHQEDAAAWGIRLGLHGLAFLYSLYGGLLTPAFTRTWLRARGERAPAIHVPLEYVTASAMLAFAAADLSGAGDRWVAATALAACAVHVVRAARWRGWRTRAEPLLWTLHLGYAWFIAMFILRAVAGLSGAVPRDVWIHAFTLGALGLAMMGLMTRVALRHTGRALVMPRPMRWAALLTLAAALLRLAYSVHGLEDWVLSASSLAWSAGFALFLLRHGMTLLQPSLPRAPRP